MSTIVRPRFWICTVAGLAALWITFRVLDADAAPRRPVVLESVADELPDPALDALIDRLVVSAERSHRPR